MVKNLLLVLLLILLLFRPLQLVFSQSNKFFGRNYWPQFSTLDYTYKHSQYVMKKNTTTMLDEQFEAYAGGIFLKGLNPILIVHDHPPLGRYLISLCILIFDNANIIILFVLPASVIGLYFISRMIFPNAVLSLIPVVIFVNEPLFLNKLVYTPLPEPIQLPFIIFAIYFFLRAVNVKEKSVRSSNGKILEHITLSLILSFPHFNPFPIGEVKRKSRQIIGEKEIKEFFSHGGEEKIWWFIATSIMLGFVICTRFFVTGAALTFGMGLFLLLVKQYRKFLIPFIMTLPAAIIVLMLTYTRSIQDAHSLLAPFKIQKYILAYHKSALTNPLSFWDLLLFNRWHTWWGNRAISSDPQWIILWPIATVCTAILFLFGLLKKFKISLEEIFLGIWLLIYSLVLSIGYSSTRYFLPILPFLYILGWSFVVKIITVYFAKKGIIKK